MNKLEMRNAYFKKLRDILASFFSSVTLPFFSPRPSDTDFRQGSDSNNRPVSGQTKLGSISIHFQGAATAVRERVRMEKEWGCICVVWWEKCRGSQARYDSGKTIKNTEETEQWDKQPSSLLVFGKLFEFYLEFFCVCFSGCLSSCFLFLFTASWGGGHLSSLIVKTPAFQWLSCTLAEL